MLKTLLGYKYLESQKNFEVTIQVSSLLHLLLCCLFTKHFILFEQTYTLIFIWIRLLHPLAPNQINEWLMLNFEICNNIKRISLYKFPYLIITNMYKYHLLGSSSYNITRLQIHSFIKNYHIKQIKRKIPQSELQPN